MPDRGQAKVFFRELTDMLGKPETENLFNDFGSDYDRMITWDVRLKREGSFFRDLFDRYQVRSVLDAACGTGRHALLFAGWGLEVTGVDLSPTMVVQARALAAEQGVPAQFIQAGFGGLNAADGGEFDALVCIGNSLPHLKTLRELNLALTDFHRALRPGGVLVIQNRNYNKVLAEKSRFMPVNQDSMGVEETLYLRITDFPDNDPGGLVTFNIVVLHKDTSGKWNYRVHSEKLKPWLKEELTEALAGSGFKNPRYFGDYSGGDYQPESSADLIIVAEKNS